MKKTLLALMMAVSLNAYAAQPRLNECDQKARNEAYSIGLAVGWVQGMLEQSLEETHDEKETIRRMNESMPDNYDKMVLIIMDEYQEADTRVFKHAARRYVAWVNKIGRVPTKKQSERLMLDNIGQVGCSTLMAF